MDRRREALTKQRVNTYLAHKQHLLPGSRLVDVPAMVKSSITTSPSLISTRDPSSAVTVKVTGSTVMCMEPVGVYHTADPAFQPIAASIRSSAALRFSMLVAIESRTWPARPKAVPGTSATPACSIRYSARSRSLLTPWS